MDIDFITDLSNGSFRVSLGSSTAGVNGNRALLNRFEVTFLTKKRQFIWGDSFIADPYGGDANKFINRPQILNDTQSIAASVSIVIDQTVQSMLNDQPSEIPDTEKLSSASLLSLDIVDDIITASIEVVPVEVESYDLLKLNLPITKV